MISRNGKLAFREQTKLVNWCMKRGRHLNEELELRGLSYDDLRYRHSSPIKASPAAYKTLEDFHFEHHGIPAISFFSGAGGLDLGFKNAGFNTLALIENNAVFCETLRLNFTHTKIIGPPEYSGDVRDREKLVKILRRQLGITRNFEGVFHGGPPCQPFSVASNQRYEKTQKNFKRIGFSHSEYGNLLLDFLWFVEQFRPRVFLIENVVGLLTIDSGEQLSEAMKFASTLGYDLTTPTVLNAAHYAVPQNRYRLFIVGWRKSRRKFKFPPQQLLQVPTYMALEREINRDNNHVTRDHKAESIIRYMQLEYGERDDLGRVDRLDPTLPAKTVIAGGTSGGGRSHLHPEVPRTLSVRECARLQTFPDSFSFLGTPARQFTQVGNAVPPLLALELARAIYQNIFR